MNKEDLQQIRAIVQEETRTIVQEETRAIVREETRAIVKEEIEKKIDDFAIVVGKSFEHVERRIDSVEIDVAEIKTNLVRVEQKIDQIDFRTQNQVDSVYEDVHILKDDMKEVKADIVFLKKQQSVVA
ncbi:MAG: hypothetical protein WCG84_01345 [Candidatus Moraniibacteriota bacterium]